MNAYIFRCSERTFKECIDRSLFGASDRTRNSFSGVKIGDTLFLYNTTRGLLYGPFIAASNIEKNIVKEAWDAEFPWQVKVSVSKVPSPISGKLIDGLVSFFRGIPSAKISGEQASKLIDLLKNAVEPLDSEQDFREKFPRNKRSEDGHFFQSKSEVLIDDWLYKHWIVHESEHKLPGFEDLHSDFGIPTKDGVVVYIEYWGLDTDRYLRNKERKLEKYKKYSYKLIELTREDLNDLDKTLGVKLKPYYPDL